MVEAGQYDDAETLLSESLEITCEVKGELHPSTSNAERKMGFFLLRVGKYAEAEKLLRSSLSKSQELSGTESRDVAQSLHSLGVLWAEQARYDDAREALREASRIFTLQESSGLDQLDQVQVESELAAVLCHLGLNEEADQLHGDVLQRLTKSGHPAAAGVLAIARSRYGVCLTETGHPNEAETKLLAAFSEETRLEAAERTHLIRSLVALYESWGKPDKAAEYRALLKETEDTNQ